MSTPLISAVAETTPRHGIAVDNSGNAYVTGITASTNFPTTPGSLQPTAVPSYFDAFVTAINPNGSAFLYSTYLGGPNETLGNGIAVDGSGNAYVTGASVAGNFPTTPGAFSVSSAAGSAFVAKLNASGSSLIYAAQLGGSGLTQGFRIAVDGSGNAYVTGVTQAADFPTKNPLQAVYGGGNGDAFVTELNAAGTALVYSTFLGGSGRDEVASAYPYPTAGGIAVDRSGNIYVTGITESTDFPTKNALQNNYGGGQYDAFAAEINPSQTGPASLVYSTYLGGGDEDEGFGIAVDNSGNAYVAGFTFSLNFPTMNAYQPQRTAQTTKHAAIGDAFLTKLTFA